MSDIEDEVEIDDEEANDLTNSDIVTKYKVAGDIANQVLLKVIELCKPDKRIIDICTEGDTFIIQGVSSVYNKGKIEKGIAFPTCISVNNCVGHASPLLSDEDAPTLKEGDLVKIDLGVHVDGYIAVVAHTELCTDGSTSFDDSRADVTIAARTAAEYAVRMMQPGNKNTDITEGIAKIAAAYKVECCEGVLSHQMKRHVIDGNKVIINKATVEQKVDEAEIEVNDVFALDVVMSTGEGKPKEFGARTTVFKRAADRQYNLKMKASRQFFSEVNSKFPSLPFTLRACEDEKKTLLGMVECVKHELLHPYPVLFEKEGVVTAHSKFTVLVTANGPILATQAPVSTAVSKCKVEDEDINAVLAISMDRKKKKKQKKKASGDSDAKVE